MALKAGYLSMKMCVCFAVSNSCKWQHPETCFHTFILTLTNQIQNQLYLFIYLFFPCFFFGSKTSVHVSD